MPCVQATKERVCEEIGGENMLKGDVEFRAKTKLEVIDIIRDNHILI